MTKQTSAELIAEFRREGSEWPGKYGALFFKAADALEAADQRAEVSDRERQGAHGAYDLLRQKNRQTMEQRDALAAVVEKATVVARGPWPYERKGAARDVANRVRVLLEILATAPADAPESAEQERNQLAAVIEKAEDYVTRHYLDTRFGAEVLPMLATAPADALRVVKAEAWDEGADAMAEHIDNGAWWEIQNPYREEQS